MRSPGNECGYRKEKVRGPISGIPTVSDPRHGKESAKESEWSALRRTE